MKSTAYPHKQVNSAGEYFDGYLDTMIEAVRSVDRSLLSKAGETLAVALKRDATIFTCGNGGSAAIANHLVCDYMKGIQTNTNYLPKVHSLSSNVELITAIGNDIDFADIFVYPLRTQARKGDLLITISSSGNSENIVRAVTWAKENGLDTISFTGFSGGRSSEIADINLHVPARNYGVVEDIHQSFMHTLAHYARQAAMPKDEVGEATF